jgi:hypothetical protein
MRKVPAVAVAAALVAVLSSVPARADVSLPGNQHIGDGESVTFTPKDPVTRTQMQANPTNFHLSQTTTITAVQLVNPVELDDRLQVFIDDMTTARAGTLSGSCDDGGTCIYTLTTPLTLNAGSHTIWPDGGCSTGGFAVPCLVSENDFGFDSVNLVSTQTATSRMYNRRQHLGDSNEANDDYGGKYYPDSKEGSPLSFTFNLDLARVLSEIRFYRLRDVNTAPLSYGYVSVDGTFMGNLTADGTPLILSTSVLLAAGNHTLEVTAGQSTGADQDDASWDDVVLIIVNNPATTPGEFNAVDVGGDAGTGQLRTKIAGSAFDVDLVAVTSGAQFAAYTGTVSVELLDASTTTGTVTSGTNCDAGWTSVATLAAGVTFAAADAGRKTVSLTYADALKDARLRITDSALGVTGCSTDNFAVRPDTLASVSVTHDDSRTAGTTESLQTSGITATSNPVHRAGQKFTIQATAYNAASVVTPTYSGSPTLLASASVPGMGSTVGSLSMTGAWTATGGTLRNDTVAYSEVGAVTARLVDTDYAVVDADDSTDAERWIGPVYFDIGRFIPDHFTFAPLVDAEFSVGCTSGGFGFTYIGQRFDFAAQPSALVTAVAFGGTSTLNYDGTLYKIPIIDAVPGPGHLDQAATTYAALAHASFDQTAIPNPNNTFVNQGLGVSLYTVAPSGGYRFTRGAPEGPFDADIAIAVTLTDSDGVTLEPSPAGFGELNVGDGIPFGNGTTTSDDFREMRFGRLAIDNAHGSEKLALPVPLRVEYWETTGGAGFVRNLLDSCTSLAVGDFALSGDLGGPPDPPADTSVFSLSAFLSGLATLTLSAPGDPGQATISASLAATGKEYLQAYNPIGGNYDADPTAIATFGIASNNPRRVYQREVIR